MIARLIAPQTQPESKISGRPENPLGGSGSLIGLISHQKSDPGWNSLGVFHSVFFFSISSWARWAGLGPRFAHFVSTSLFYQKCVNLQSELSLFFVNFFFFENLSELSSLGIKRYTYPCYLTFLQLFLCIWHYYFCQFILLINLFLLLFMSFIVFFGIIYESKLYFIRMGVKPIFYSI